MGKNLKPCPYCGSTNLDDCHAYIRCNTCYMCGPKVESHNTIGLSVVDFGFAATVWNNLPRKEVVNI